MSTDYHDIGPVVKEYWAIISGTVTALWYAGVRVQKMLFSKFVTHNDLSSLRDDIEERFRHIDNKIESNTDRIMDVLLKHHEIMIKKDGHT